MLRQDCHAPAAAHRFCRRNRASLEISTFDALDAAGAVVALEVEYNWIVTGKLCAAASAYCGVPALIGGSAPSASVK